MWRRCRGFGYGLAATVAVWAAAARGAEPAAAAGAAAGTCELPRVVDRAQEPSVRCIACHDGTSGPGLAFEMGRGAAPGQSMSHPVEVDYGRARDAAPDRYVPEPLIPADVPLVGGKVACTSCHDGRSSHAKQVVDPARLCYACHRL